MNNTKRSVSCPQLTKLTLILTLLLGWGSQAWGYDPLTINSSATGSNYGIPFNAKKLTTSGHYGEFIVTSTQLSAMSGKNITGIKFYCKKNPDFGEATFSVCMKEVTETAYSSAAALGDTGTKEVYSGSLEITGTSDPYELNIPLSDAFPYSGTKNLLIRINVTNTEGTNSKDDLYFYGYSAYVGDYTSYGTTSSTIRFRFQPKVTFTYEDAAVPTLSITPDEDIDFGTKWANAYEEVSITNNSGSTVNVVPSLDGTDAASFSITDDEDNDISAGSVNIDSESSMTFRIHYTYDSSSLGKKTATITFTPDVDSKNAITKNITLTAVSDNDPELSVSPNNDTNLGTVYSGEVEYTVTNTGTGSMTVNITSDNSDFVVSPTSISGLAYNESETFTVTYTFAETAEKIGTNTANITVTPTYDGGAAKNYEVSATSNATMTLDENNATTVNYGTKTYLHVKYTPSAGWNTISMPFVLYNSSQSIDYMTPLFGEGWKAYTLSSYSNGTLTFSKVSSSAIVNYGTPYLVYIESAPIHSNGVLLKNPYTLGNTVGSTTKGDATFQGTYSRKDYNAETDELTPWYGVVPSGQILKAGTDAYVMGYRAYFTGVTPPAGARLTIAIDDDGETTDLGFVKMVDPEAKDVYTLSGQKVLKAGKGIYILNGRKVVIK